MELPNPNGIEWSTDFKGGGIVQFYRVVRVCESWNAKVSDMVCWDSPAAATVPH